MSLCPLLLGSGHEASLGVMADDDDVAEDWEDVDTEVRKWLTKNLVIKIWRISVHCTVFYLLIFPHRN